MQLEAIPVQESWHLNERHYGALEGMERWQAIKKFGIWPILGCQIKFDAAPPYLNSLDPRFPGNQACHKDMQPDEWPVGESMQQTLARLEPYWRETIQPEIRLGKRILIVSHKNTLRTLMMLLDQLVTSSNEADHGDWAAAGLRAGSATQPCAALLCGLLTFFLTGHVNHP